MALDSLSQSNETLEAANPENWVRLYGDYLYRYALSRLRDPSVAEDCVQDTLLAAIQGLDNYDPRREIKFWLRGIMRNKIIDVFRKQKRQSTINLGDDEAILESALYKYSGIAALFPEAWKFDPRTISDHAEFMRVFQSCLDQLKEPMREAFVLKMIEGHDLKEVCKVLEIEPNHLWVLLHRAREQLKKLLEVEWKVN
jgi:RNA polymerase sigma-70 factor (ECF subfamily)